MVYLLMCSNYIIFILVWWDRSFLNAISVRLWSNYIFPWQLCLWLLWSLDIFYVQYAESVQYSHHRSKARRDVMEFTVCTIVTIFTFRSLPDCLWNHGTDTKSHEIHHNQDMLHHGEFHPLYSTASTMMK